MLLGYTVPPTGWTAVFGDDPPGLKRTMARRQPSSVLSICMSFILDTSSVRTLRGVKAVLGTKTRKRSHGDTSPFFETYLSKMEPTPAL